MSVGPAGLRGLAPLWYLWVFRALTLACSLPSLGEEEISFPPTYRYERGSRDTYAWHKQKPTGVSEGNGQGDLGRRLWAAVNQERVSGQGLASCYSSFGGPSKALGVGDPGCCEDPRGEVGAEAWGGGSAELHQLYCGAHLSNPSLWL